MNWLIRLVFVLLLLISISGCVKPRPAKLPPVTEGWRQPAAIKNGYIVQKKDTLYAIAWALGMDYRELAVINHLQPPYVLHHKQRLYFATTSAKSSFKSKLFKTTVSAQDSKIDRHDPVIKPLFGWIWPTTGKVALPFENKLGGNKGIDITGVYGQSVTASNKGVVVYSGTGILSYGKLIIIKHNDDYLSAYAYNKEMLVREGMEVRGGQKIATLGHNNEGLPRLHFEIRRFGKPVNPLSCLPKKP